MSTLNALLHLADASLDTIALGLRIAADPPPGPPKLDGLFTQLFNWLKGIIMVGGGFFLMIDMAKHVFSSPRDLRAAGIDLVVFVVLLAFISQANTIVAWAMSAIS